MPQPHISLRPATNIILIIVWASLAILFSSKFNPLPLPVLVAGAIFGVAGGIMQVLGIREGRHKFRNVKTALDVRQQLKTTEWGKRYLYSLWTSSIAIFLISLSARQPLNALFAGYCTMCFFRDVITLKSAFELAKLAIRS